LCKQERILTLVQISNSGNQAEEPKNIHAAEVVLWHNSVNQWCEKEDEGNCERLYILLPGSRRKNHEMTA
jgi:hypothetical protein